MTDPVPPIVSPVVCPLLPRVVATLNIHECFAVLTTAIPLPFEAYTLLHHATHPPMAHLMSVDQQLPTLFHNHVLC